MKWFTVINRENAREELPLDKVFFALWKGAFCISEFDDDENCFYISFLPAQMTGLMKVSLDREYKFTHFCIPEYPKDYWNEKDSGGACEQSPFGHDKVRC